MNSFTYDSGLKLPSLDEAFSLASENKGSISFQKTGIKGIPLSEISIYQFFGTHNEFEIDGLTFVKTQDGNDLRFPSECIKMDFNTPEILEIKDQIQLSCYRNFVGGAVSIPLFINGYTNWMCDGSLESKNVDLCHNIELYNDELNELIYDTYIKGYLPIFRLSRCGSLFHVESRNRENGHTLFEDSFRFNRFQEMNKFTLRSNFINYGQVHSFFNEMCDEMGCVVFTKNGKVGVLKTTWYEIVEKLLKSNLSDFSEIIKAVAPKKKRDDVNVFRDVIEKHPKIKNFNRISSEIFDFKVDCLIECLEILTKYRNIDKKTFKKCYKSHFYLDILMKNINKNICIDRLEKDIVEFVISRADTHENAEDFLKLITIQRENDEACC